MEKVRLLSAGELRRKCEEGLPEFTTTADLEVLEGVIEQARAVESLKTGLGIDKRNYNIFVAGASGTGRTTIVRSIVGDVAKRREEPPDWVYVHNFKDKENPRALRLPAGRGREFARDMETLVGHLKEALPAAFRARDHQEEIQQIVSRSLAREHEHFASLSRRAAEIGFTVKSTKTGLITIPTKDERVLTNKDYEGLTDEEKKEIEDRRRALEPHIHEFVSMTRSIESETQEKIKRKQARLARKVCARPVGKLNRKYGKFDGVGEYLRQVKQHMVENLGKFVREEGAQGGGEVAERDMIEYRVNVVVDNGELWGAPVIVEPRPTYYNLFGRIEKKVENGVYFTDFTMIKAGSVLQANGGYLLINTNDLFAFPLVWENLKSVLRYQQITIEDIGEHLGFLPTSGLRPEPIPINLKIILVGPPYVYEILHGWDEDFRKLFQVKADFDYEMKRTSESILEYARFVATTCRKEGLRPVTRDGVARVVEFGSRLVESQDRVTLQFNQICNLLIEADTLAEADGTPVIERIHVSEAIRQRERRLSLLEEKIRDEILDQSILIDSSGERVGVVNGLAVYEVGDYSFGKPTRITAAAWAGKGGVVNVEREARLSGKIHSKGVLILSGLLGRLFGQKRPLSVSVSICLEQSYGGIDGDSASCAELYAVLSALSGVPVRQVLAVTGSVNQYGDVQPIGGVNEKVEAWYHLCRQRGLAEGQGVVIPKANVRNLMLKKEVVEAVEAGKFSIYPVARIEEGIEVLLGVECGQLGEDFKYLPETSVLARAGVTLERFAADDEEGETKKD